MNTYDHELPFVVGVIAVVIIISIVIVVCELLCRLQYY